MNGGGGRAQSSSTSAATAGGPSGPITTGETVEGKFKGRLKWYKCRVERVSLKFLPRLWLWHPKRDGWSADLATLPSLNPRRHLGTGRLSEDERPPRLAFADHADPL